MVQALIINASKHTHDVISASKLCQADRAKFTRTEVRSLIQDNLLLGRLNVCEALLKAHQAEPYKDVDELIGDLQILLVHSSDELRKANHSYLTKIRLEDLIPRTEDANTTNYH